ncbi:MAG: cupredoxin domain-containing protein [Burkholderiales bacterium]
MKKTVLPVILLAALATPLAARAETPDFAIAIENHRFVPSELTVPAGRKLKLVIENRDATPEEFESHDLRREKVIAGKSKGEVWVGPLEAGTYGFYGEYYEKTAQGRLIAK